MFAHTGPLLILAAICAGILCFIAPIPQDLAYHDFVDARAWMGIPNFGDVAGNLPFLLVGFLGMGWVSSNRQNREHFIDPREATPAWVACFGFFLVGIGSAYYHLDPNNSTLVWDRLPMTIGFMGVFSMMLMERISVRVGLKLFLPLLLIGACSVVYWALVDDLRPYAFVQFFPMIAIPFMLWRNSPRYTGVKYLGWVLFWYVAAKLLEHFDVEIFVLLDGLVSGHTLKHLAAAIATWYVVLYLKNREPNRALIEEDFPKR